MCMMPRAVPCKWAQNYNWLEHESEQNLHLAFGDSPRAFFFCSFSCSLFAFLASFVHWLSCFLFLSVANCWRRSALNSTKYLCCGGPAALSSTSSIVKKRHSSLSLTSFVSALDAWVSEHARKCKWVQTDIPEHDRHVCTYACTYIARIDPSFKASR